MDLHTFDVLIEVTSVPLLKLVSGAMLFTQITPGEFIWAGLVLLSCLRRRPWLCLLAGGIAALEMIALRIHFMGPVTKESLFGIGGFMGSVMSAVALALLGVEAALICRHFNRKAEEAMREMRQREVFGKYFLHGRIAVGGWPRCSAPPTRPRAASSGPPR